MVDDAVGRGLHPGHHLAGLEVVTQRQVVPFGLEGQLLVGLAQSHRLAVALGQARPFRRIQVKRLHAAHLPQHDQRDVEMIKDVGIGGRDQEAQVLLQRALAAAGLDIVEEVAAQILDDRIVVIDLAQVQPQPSGLDAGQQGAAVEIAAAPEEPLARRRWVVAHRKHFQLVVRITIDQGDQGLVAEQVAFVQVVGEQQVLAREVGAVLGGPVQHSSVLQLVSFGA